MMWKKRYTREICTVEIKMNKTTKRILRFVPLVIMMAVIFFFSAMEGDESSDTSSRFLQPIINLVEGITHHDMNRSTIESLHWLIRKAAHFTEYAIFGIMALFAFNGLFKKKIWLIIVPEIISFLYALSDEFHQYFVPGRYASFGDVMIDSSGALVGILIVGAIIKKHEKV